MTNRIVIAGLALAAAVAASVWPVTSVDLKWLDLQWRMSPRVEEPGPQRVAIIGIDERSLAAAREPVGLWHRQLA